MGKIPLKYRDRRQEGTDILRQCQLVQLHLLHVVDRLCKDNGISYYLIGGTLLGAIRHNGFIPWDDDLDIGMPLKDYRRFLKVARTELPKDVLLQTRDDTPGRMTPFVKIRDAYSLFFEATASASMGVHSGIFIDVFPQYEIPALGLTLERWLVKLCKKTWRYGRGLRTSGRRGWFFALFGGWMAIPFYAVNKFLHAFFWLGSLMLPCKRVYHDIDFSSFAFIEKKLLYPLGNHRFEDADFPVPKESIALLSSRYGDWQRLPPEHERHPEHGHVVLPYDSPDVPGAMTWGEARIG